MENTIALINIVFLMLIFFLVAGTLAPPLDSSVTMIETENAEQAEPPDALAVTAEGAFRYRGAETSLERFLSENEDLTGQTTMRLVVDRALPADMLVAITGRLREAGFESVSVVTERAAQ